MHNTKVSLSEVTIKVRFTLIVAALSSIWFLANIELHLFEYWQFIELVSCPVAKRDHTQGRVEVGASWSDNSRPPTSRHAASNWAATTLFCFSLRKFSYIHTHLEEIAFRLLLFL